MTTRDHVRMDTPEEPECPPHKARIFVTSTKEFEGLPSKVIIPVQFVSLLTSIHLTEEKCLLGFSNFEEGKDKVENRYLIKLKFKDRSSERLARMTISLVCQYFDIEIPDLDSSSNPCSTLILEDIHLDRLCFSSCKALYVSKYGNYTLFLEDIKPLDLINVMNTISKDSKRYSSKHNLLAPISSPDLKKSLIDTFNNLIKMNRDEKNSFKFVKLIHYDIEFKEFIQERQKLLSQKSKPRPIDPFFLPNRLGAPYLESQNEFNSQLMTLNADEPITDINGEGDDLLVDADPIEDSDSSTSSSAGIFLSSRSYIQSQTPERKTKVPNNWLNLDSERTKKRKVSFTGSSAPSSQHTQVNYERLSLASLGSIEKLKGRFVGMYPPEFGSISEFKHCTLKLYFTELPLSKIPDRVLLPGVNCIEIIIPTMERICELFGILNCKSCKISNILLMNKPELVSVEIEKIMWDTDGTVSPGLPIWSLKDINADVQTQAPAPLLPLANPPLMKVREMEKKDPTIEFCELKLSAFETKYVTMFGMIVSCSFDRPDFVSFVFTDFTKNNIVQNYLYDRYLVDYEAKLELDEGYKAIMYKNQFEAFDLKIEKIFGKRLSKLQNNRDENLSQHAIVCKMNIKLKIYNAKLNAIVRECVPVPYAQASTIVSPSQGEHLHSFYRRAFNRIGESAISRYFEGYSRFFPIQRNNYDLAELKLAAPTEQDPTPTPTPTPVEYIPDLNADVSSFDVEFTDIFPLLNTLTRRPQPQPHKNDTLYSCKGSIVAIEYHSSDLCLHVSDRLPLPQTHTPHPHHVLQLHITTSKNFAYFFNRTTAYLHGQGLDERYTQLAQFIGHPFKFNITSSLKILPTTAVALQIWCPIECTLRELQQQLAHHLAEDTPDSRSLVGCGMTVNPPRLLSAPGGVTVKREKDNDDGIDAVTASS